MIEGVSSDPDARVGDPNNRVTNGNDAACRPEAVGADGLPANFDEIAQVIAAQKLVAAQVIQQETGLTRDQVFRFVDFYSVSELRLPPNPLAYLKQAGQLDGATAARIDEGAALFRSVGCANCHDPDNARHPFADGLNHGGGADWVQRFVNTYSNDQRILDSIGGFAQKLLDAISPSVPDNEINVHLDPIDYFVPFCFDVTSCLSFEDPLVVRGNRTEETRRLQLLIDVNLADPLRQFIPGNVRGAVQMNTPSLRGVWTQANLLHHGLVHTIAEAVLGPGHAALQEGELGFAVDALGSLDVHGKTRSLSKTDVQALIRYVENIE